MVQITERQHISTEEVDTKSLDRMFDKPTEIKDRFEAGENPCDRCKWLDEVTGTEFPCSHCIHNNALDNR